MGLRKGEGMSEIVQINSVDLSVIFDDKIKVVTELFEQWKRFGNLSRVIRLIDVITSVVAAVGAGIYAYYSDKAWYMIALYVLGGFAAVTVVFGILILLMKPFFWWNRKKQKEVHAQITQLEEELKLMELSFARTRPSDFSSYPIGTITDAQEDLLQYYQELTQQIYICGYQWRELEMDKARWDEWCRVISAGVVFMAIIALIISYIIFAVAVVFLIVYFAAVGLNNSDYPCGYEDYEDHDYKRESLFDAISEASYGRLNIIKDMIEKVMDTIGKSLAKREKVYSELQGQGLLILTKESQTLSYLISPSKRKKYKKELEFEEEFN